eukprot:5417769-Pleurochrysis_carterae.AAC.2
MSGSGGSGCLRARVRDNSGSRSTVRRWATSVSLNLKGASFLIRRKAKHASPSLLAAFAATASRFARRFASLALWRSTALRQV